MSLISTAVGGVLGGLGSTSESMGSWGGYGAGGTGNSAQTAMNFNNDMVSRQMAYNAEQAAIAREHSAIEAQKQRDWTAEQSSTAYQRAVEDLKKAGLNPILAASRGGAETGTGAMGAISSANASVLGGMTDNNWTQASWGSNSAYSYSNLGEAIGNAISGIANMMNVAPSGGNKVGNTSGSKLISGVLDMGKSTVNKLNRGKTK